MSSASLLCSRRTGPVCCISVRRRASVRWLSQSLEGSQAGVNTALLLRRVARLRSMALILLRCKFARCEVMSGRRPRLMYERKIRSAVESLDHLIWEISRNCFYFFALFSFPFVSPLNGSDLHASKNQCISTLRFCTRDMLGATILQSVFGGIRCVSIQHGYSRRLCRRVHEEQKETNKRLRVVSAWGTVVLVWLRGMFERGKDKGKSCVKSVVCSMGNGEMSSGREQLKGMCGVERKRKRTKQKRSRKGKDASVNWFRRSRQRVVRQARDRCSFESRVSCDASRRQILGSESQYEASKSSIKTPSRLRRSRLDCSSKRR